MAARRTQKLLDTGARAPDFRLQRLEGGEVAPGESMANGPVLLAFYKVSCPVCQLTLPFLERIHTAGRLAIFAISQNDAEDTREFNRYYGISIPTLLDGEEAGFPASNAFGISSVPTMFLVERDGTVARVIEGWQRAEIERLGALGGVQPFHAEDNVPQWKAG
jgi:peroxiredoxin